MEEFQEKFLLKGQRNYDGEFDPGSGRTLAAGLIHASRGVTGIFGSADDRRTGA